MGSVSKYRSYLLVLFALAAILLTGAPEALRNALTDVRFRLMQRQASGDIVLVAIDSPSIDAIGVWPWPRAIHAKLIEKLARAGAGDIAFDVDFSARSGGESDRAFAQALQRAGGSIVLPSFAQQVDLHKTIHLNHPLRQFADHSWPAVVNVSAESDGVVRRYPYGDTFDGGFLPSMAAVLAGKHDAGKKPFWIDFSISMASTPIVSYVDVLRDDPVAIARLKDKKVLVGATALELGDRFNLPNGQIVSGALLQMLAAESVLQGRTLRAASDLVRWAGPSLVALLVLVFWRRRSALIRVAIVCSFSVAAEIVAFFVQAKLSIILDTSLLHLAAAACLGAITLDEIDFRDLLGRIADRRFQRITMSLGDGVVCVDQDGAITLWNPGARAIFGYTAEEMIGQPFARIFAGPTAARAAFSVLNLPVEKLTSAGGTVMELDGRRKNGEMFALEACFSGWRGTDGRQYGAILRDISDRKREEARIRYLAEHDTLTGLANRNALQESLCTAIPQAQADAREVALLAISIDKFQLMNDMLGHEHGDEVVRAVAERLSSLVKAPNLLARLGSDEFAVAICEDNAAEQATQLAGRVCRRFMVDPIPIGMREQSIRLSVGLAVCPRDSTTADELIGNAHLALDRAKAVKRGGYVPFERGIRNELESRLILEAELARAIERNEFELFYQPQVTLGDGRLIGAEALIRWRHPERGLVAPFEFMSVVNTSSISDRTAFWVLRTACRQARSWQERGHTVPIAVNLAPSQLRSEEVVLVVGDVLAETGCPAQLLELEVTEDILVEDANAVEIFRRLRDLGVRILLDDFGTGYASLSYLKKFPLDGLKIDRSFVQNLQPHSDDAAIVESIIGLSKSLRLSVVAEGIEDRATNELLLRMGCKQGQGYYFGRPTPATEFEKKYLGNACGEEGSEVARRCPTAA